MFHFTPTLHKTGVLRMFRSVQETEIAPDHFRKLLPKRGEKKSQNCYEGVQGESYFYEKLM